MPFGPLALDESWKPKRLTEDAKVAPRELFASGAPFTSAMVKESPGETS